MQHKNSLKKLGLFSFFILLLATQSCKKPEQGVGENLLPGEDELFAFSNDSTPITVTTVEHPSGKIRTDFYTNTMIGNFRDPVFGKVRTSSYLQFDVSSSSASFQADVEIEKVVLNLVYYGRELGTKAPQYMVVNKLTEGMEYDSLYYNTSELAYESENLISPGFELVNTQSELAGTYVAGQAKSLSLRLKPEFGDFLLSASTEDYSSLDRFSDYFKGLRVSSQTVDAQAINYDLRDTQTKLTVYYHNMGSDTTRQFDFILSDSCKHFTRVEHLHENSALSDLENDIDGSYQIYPQSAGGSAIKVDLSEVDWLREDENITINKAWLVLPLDSSGGYDPLESFSAHFYDEDGEMQVIMASSTSALFTVLREDAGYYYLNLTSFLQDYAEGSHDYTEIYLLPQVVTLNANRAVIKGTNYNATDKGQNTRLLITYSK